MNLQRINTMIIRSWFHLFHTMETWVDLFWNSAMQMFLFVLMAKAISGSNSSVGLYMTAGMILWQIIWISQYEVTVGPLWEIWSHSLSSLFITPLTLKEFMIAQMVSGITKSIIAVLIAETIARVFYGFTIFSLGPVLILYAIELLVVGWSLGFFVLSTIMKYGTDVQSLSWSIIFILQPLGGIFYPSSILPGVLKNIPYLLPTGYLFESIHSQLVGGEIKWDMIGWATIINLIYFVLTALLLQRSFKQAKKSGTLARMEA